MRKFIFFVVAALFITGCADKKYIHEPAKNELLAYTAKQEIINANMRILALGTYLNPNSGERENERFVLAIYPKETQINQASFKLNGKAESLVVRQIEQDDEILSKVSFEMPWGAYYEVVSPQIDSDTLTLSFEIYPSNAVSLKFQKVAKSMYWSSGAVRK